MSERSDEMNQAAEVAPFADALRTLVPAGTAISRDRLLFEAGRAAAAPRFGWLWPCGTLLFAAISLALAGWAVFEERPAQTVVVERERVVEVRVPAPVEAPAPSPNLTEVKFEGAQASRETVQMYQVRRDMFRWGVALLPPTKPMEKARAVRDATGDLERWLEVPAGTLTAPYAKPSPLFPMMNGDD